MRYHHNKKTVGLTYYIGRFPNSLRSTGNAGTESISERPFRKVKDEMGSRSK